MYYYKKEQLPPAFHDAITLCEFAHLKWEDLYMDPHGELAIKFADKLSEGAIRMVLMHFLDIIYNECNLNKINPKEDIDYTYLENNKKVVTIVYTPDNISYKEIVRIHALTQV